MKAWLDPAPSSGAPSAKRRAAAPGARLFVFTVSRHTLPPEEQPVAGETFVFTRFSGEPQVFLTRAVSVFQEHDDGETRND